MTSREFGRSVEAQNDQSPLSPVPRCSATIRARIELRRRTEEVFGFTRRMRDSGGDPNGDAHNDGPFHTTTREELHADHFYSERTPR